MGKSKDFKNNVERVFGHKPKCKKRRIGFNIAALYFGPFIGDAEQALKEPGNTPYDLKSNLTFAFKFSSQHAGMHAFSKPTRHAIEKYARKFKKRYAPLVAELTDPSPS